MNATSDKVVLTVIERKCIYDYHMHWASIWQDSADNNEAFACEANEHEQSVFLSDPCENLHKTPTNWRKRADVFRLKKEEHLKRAKLFE
jgi:hypothetical protein